LSGYCLDTNALIDLHWRRYPRRVFASLWEEIDSAINTGTVKVPEDVIRELEHIEDGTYEWIKSVAAVVVIPLSGDIQVHASRVMAAHPNLVRTKRGKATSQADPFVIASAIHRKIAVVTGEQKSGNIAHPKIPDVCRVMGVRCLNLVEMFDSAKWRV
jgi:hypothetical protein